MIQRIAYTSLLTFFIQSALAQHSQLDSLRHQDAIEQNDTLRMLIYARLSNEYTESSPDSAYYYANKELSISKKLNLKLEELHAIGEMGYASLNMGNYPRALQLLLPGILTAEDPKSEDHVLSARFPPTDEFTDRTTSPHIQRLTKLARIHQYTGILYGNNNSHEKALVHYLLAQQYAEQTGNLRAASIANSTLGRAYLTLKKVDSALITGKRAYSQALQVGYKRYVGSMLINLARAYSAKGDKQLAAEYFRRGRDASAEQGYLRGIVAANLALADLHKQSGRLDSVLPYINSGLPSAYALNAPELLLRSYTALADYYKTKNVSDSAVKYQSFIIKINDSLFNSKQAQQFQNIDFDEQQRKQQIEAAKTAYRIKFRMYALIAGLVIFVFIAILLARNSRHRKKANALLSRQKKELESALTSLRATQKQLIQSEKMASLGELTAGIAHEIQNPLNFVNNFSDINTELIDELIAKLQSNEKEEALDISKDIRDNEQKINFHGKRADGIVKGMLQHSRASSGQKELSDINVLAEECLRLSYHGMRAKDNSFNVTMNTDFDPRIEKINVIPQDIGRVFLNLFTNAFYSVSEKRSLTIRSNGAEPSITSEFEPQLSVVTRKVGDKLEIRVRDNGMGIPQKVVEKIFQPFFTTKPTGQGTGLGLSLSYDIIKAHDGEIKVDTREGEYTEFIIELPAK